MGGEPTLDPIMTRTCWWLTDVFSRMLEPDEREAVLGDFAESGETATPALLGVLGLVLRRQALLWAAWRPWLTLVGVILPLGMLLSIVSRNTAYGCSIYLWLYADNWDWALLRNPGFWRVLAESAWLVSVWAIMLACAAWTSGFVLGSVSRRMIQINGVLLCVMLLFGELVAAPLYFSYIEEYLKRTFHVSPGPDYNAAVFDVTFYRVMFPLIVQVVLVAIPALWGLGQGAGATKLRPLLRTVLWTAAIATLAAMLIQERGFWLLLNVHLLNAHILNSFMHPAVWLAWGMRILQFVVYWPILYLFANGIRRRWHDTIATV